MELIKPLIQKTLSAELTCIPNKLQRFLGKSFNNTLCNAIFWLFLIWMVLYFCYSKALNIILKRKSIPKYQRDRLSSTLWTCSVYLSFICYFFSKTPNFQEILQNITVAQYKPNQDLLQAIVCSFFLHLACRSGSFVLSLRNVGFVAVCTVAYIYRFTNVLSSLTFLHIASNLLEDVARISYSYPDNSGRKNIFFRMHFIVSLIFFCFVYLFIIPFYIMVPLAMNLVTEGTSQLSFLFMFLSLWMILVVYKSAPSSLLTHLIHHKKNLEVPFSETCLGNVVECSLFPPRTDDGYMMSILRAEIKSRQKKMIAMRKPKNKNMLVQTLKCMMTIKRKLNEKKKSIEGNEANEEVQVQVDEEEEQCSLETSQEDDKNSEDSDEMRNDELM